MMPQTTRRRVRQSAVRIFAQEFSEASLIEPGVGEYDPSFVVTKLGAKVNRSLVGGVIDRIERREGNSGPYYSGQIRDPTGAHYFDVASFQPELHADTEELLARFESGDRFLMIMVGRARWFESEDGGVFTSIRAEDFTIVDKDRYKSWLVEAADATLRRLDAHSASMGSELIPAALEAAGVPPDLVDGLILSRGHYGDFDSEGYRVGVLQALSLASGRTDSIESIAPAPEPEQPQSEGRAELAPGPVDASKVILNLLSSKGDELVEYDALVGACTSAGASREAAEDAIESLRDVGGEIIEPRFGFFQLLQGG
jgi:RPA family protein